MAKTKVLIAVTTYPLPSRSYDELVCTAGILEDGSWIRIYPVPLEFLKGLRRDGKVESFKYNWIELDLKKRTDDFRPESHSPVDYSFKDVVVHGKIDTADNWRERKERCLVNVYQNLGQLIEDSKAPKNMSLASFKPTEILDFEIEPDEREWKKEWKEQLNQLSISFSNKLETPKQKEWIAKIPYKFYYRFKDVEGRVSRLMIEDWEIGALYWNCLKIANGNEEEALVKVRQKYFDEIAKTKDVHLFLGTTSEGHRRRWPNPFVIIGVFYPKKEIQLTLFG